MSKSISYHPFLLDNLKDPNYAALYLETHLEEDEFEFDPELLKMALRNVLEALGDSHLTAEQISECFALTPNFSLSPSILSTRAK